MNIGIIGSGGREHSLCYKLNESRIVNKIYCFPGNAGTEKIGEKIDIDVSLLNHYKQMRPSLDKSDWHIHDPSRVINASSGQIISVTGKAQEDGYECGVETWYRPNPEDNWEPLDCLLTDKPDWISPK